MSLKNLLSINDIITNETYFDMMADNYHINHSAKRNYQLMGQNNRLAFYEPDLLIEGPINYSRIKVVILLELLMITDIMIEGNEKIPSFLGIGK